MQSHAFASKCPELHGRCGFIGFIDLQNSMENSESMKSGFSTDRFRNNEPTINKLITSSKLTRCSTLETPFQLVFQNVPGRVYVSCWEFESWDCALFHHGYWFINLWESSSHMSSALAKDTVCSNSNECGLARTATRVNKTPRQYKPKLASPGKR